jgi:hypothetical protein
MSNGTASNVMRELYQGPSGGGGAPLCGSPRWFFSWLLVFGMERTSRPQRVYSHVNQGAAISLVDHRSRSPEISGASAKRSAPATTVSIAREGWSRPPWWCLGLNQGFC